MSEAFDLMGLTGLTPVKIGEITSQHSINCIWVFPKIGVPPNHGVSLINHPFWGTIIFGIWLQQWWRWRWRWWWWWWWWWWWYHFLQTLPLKINSPYPKRMKYIKRCLNWLNKSQAHDHNFLELKKTSSGRSHTFEHLEKNYPPWN